MSVRIVAVGKKHEDWIASGVERYQKRLRAPFAVVWDYLPHSARQDIAARQEESERILQRIKPDDFVVLLDEIGKNMSSPELSVLLSTQFNQSKNIVLVVGGAYGVDHAVQQRANIMWSLSKLVFPHQLVRLIVTEQLYRAQEIAAGNPYHHR